MEKDLFYKLDKARLLLEESILPITDLHGVISYGDTLFIIENGKVVEVVYG